MTKDEDQAYEQWRQARIDRAWGSNGERNICNPVIEPDWDALPSLITTPNNQKVGTVIPFSRTVDRDPNPRIPLSVPENSYPKISKKEALFWFVVGAVLMGVWLS
jgi:hypothetical protein